MKSSHSTKIQPEAFLLIYFKRVAQNTDLYKKKLLSQSVP